MEPIQSCSQELEVRNGFLIKEPTQWDGSKNDSEKTLTGQSMRILEWRGSIDYDQTGCCGHLLLL